MLAKESAVGQVYSLEHRAGRPNPGQAEAIGWNNSHEFLLFLLFDEYGKRKVVTVAPNEEVKEA